MPNKHPIIAVTGSSGAGTTSVQHAFAEIFRRLDINAANVHGDAFFRYTRDEWRKPSMTSIASRQTHQPFRSRTPTCFAELENLFREYSASGTGKIRHYAKDEEEAALHAGRPSANSPRGHVLPADRSAVLRGTARRGRRLHLDPAPLQSRSPPGASARTAAGQRRRRRRQDVDLLIGVVPVINLEWIQKIYRDCGTGTDDRDEVTATILRRMNDYINFIVPQFSITDINFQRVPTVDTSNPFEIQEAPSADQSMVVIHFRDPKRHDFPALLNKIGGAFMSRSNTMVVPGGAMTHALEVICTPIIRTLVSARPIA